MFDAFPMELNCDVSVVLSLILKKACNNIATARTKHDCAYTLLDGQEVAFPIRIYYQDEIDLRSSLLTFDQKMIYHCIFSRSFDGFIRQKHIKAILDEDYPNWAIPYILKISDEYIIEILEIVYNELKNRDTKLIKSLCLLNLQSFVCSHDRMISYWNEFYRKQYYLYENYVGNKLFSECFGFTRSMKKSKKIIAN